MKADSNGSGNGRGEGAPTLEYDPTKDHAVDVMLRERLGGEAAPDLVDRVLATSSEERALAARRAAAAVSDGKSGPGIWLIAALILLSASVVLAIALLGDGKDDSDTATQDKLKLVEPRSLAHLRELLQEAERATMHADYTLAEVRIRLSGAKVDGVPIRLGHLREGLARVEEASREESREKWCGRLRIVLKGKRYFDFLYRHDRGGQRMHVAGVGQFTIPDALDIRLRKVLMAVERPTRRHDGVVLNGEELADLPAKIGEKPRRRIVGIGLTDDELEHLERFPALAELDLRHSRNITNKGIEILLEILEPDMLRSLRLRPKAIGARTLRFLGRFEKLRDLELYSAKITDEALAGLEPLRELRSLNLSFNFKLTGESIAHIVKFPQLRRLNLSAIESIPVKALQQLRQLENLEELQLGRRFVNEEELVALRRALPRCRILWQRGW